MIQVIKRGNKILPGDVLVSIRWNDDDWHRLDSPATVLSVEYATNSSRALRATELQDGVIVYFIYDDSIEVDVID